MNTVLIAALAGAASAVTGPFTIDPFHPKNFMSVEVAKAMVNQAANPVEPVGATGVVSWGTCQDDDNIFQFSQSMTSYSPSPIKLGSNLSLNLGGTCKVPMFVEKIHVHVDWNSVHLYDQDIAVGETFPTVLKESVSWFVPSYAPRGNYAVTLTGFDNASKTDICVTANFAL